MGKVQYLFTTVRLVSVLRQPLYNGCMVTCFLFIPVISFHYFCNKPFQHMIRVFLVVLLFLEHFSVFSLNQLIFFCVIPWE